MKNKLCLLCFITLFNISCQQSPSDAKSHEYHPVKAGEKRFDIHTYDKMKLALPSGKLIEAFIADNPDKQTQGLSGIRKGELKEHQGMIFTYSAVSAKQFWMPNTYMDLDIYFLDKKMNVLHVDRAVKAHPSLKEPIPRSSIIYAQNILEIPSHSPYAKEISKGMQLKVIK
ncbi:MAG: hypothetical protein CME63_03545 [Halobacteriovoraceae bacterium]|nr:hypothetical protein [Halobacteriovoraceae bacterium]MBC96796.1 hypothetical protein [Halobacteriovoraceae bacterium]|tara:strand:+ start:91928 stop:92440 length:513 start_codon:yes stop_codon:yes gene_type:complete